MVTMLLLLLFLLLAPPPHLGNYATVVRLGCLAACELLREVLGPPNQPIIIQTLVIFIIVIIICMLIMDTQTEKGTINRLRGFVTWAT